MRFSPGKTVLLLALLGALLLLLASRFASAPENPQAAEEAVLPGRWVRRDGAALTREQREAIENLEAIGYTGGSRPAGTLKGGVTLHERGKVAPGFNLYTSGHGPEAILIDMEGNELHRWRYSFFDIWPDAGDDRASEPLSWWRRVHLFENGDLLAIFEGHAIIKVDRDSRLLFARRIGAHHDLEVRPHGDILVLTREARIPPRSSETEPVLEDFISVLDGEGREQRRLSLSRTRSSWISGSRAGERRSAGRETSSTPTRWNSSTGGSPAGFRSSGRATS